MLVKVRQAGTEQLHYKHMLPGTKAIWNQTMEEITHVWYVYLHLP